jgi:virulence-associated protein VapD
LLDIAIRRARGLGRGEKINVSHADLSFLLADWVRNGFVVVRIFSLDREVEIPVLSPEMADVYEVLREVLDRLRAAKAYGSRYVNSELLPLELQIALKRLAEISKAIAVNTLLRRGYRFAPVGSLLATCDPRVERVMTSGVIKDMLVYYVCGSHTGGFGLELEISKTDKFVTIGINI